MQNDERIREALQRCATGFDTSEVVEEFAIEDGVLKLVKRKVTKRDIPPDMKAMKMLIEGEGVDELSDEELQEEKRRLLKLLKEDGGE
jgi:sulfur relay (sulfurtransferase) DsrF/TusC family protein